MNTETNKTSAIPTTLRGKDLLKDMVQELRNFTAQVPELFETFLMEYIEVHHLTENDLQKLMRVYYPEDVCSVNITEADDVEKVILGTKITSEVQTSDAGVRINYVLHVAGSALDEIDMYPKTKQLLSHFKDGGNTHTSEGE